jgi:hydrogenase/urease accessory protein HupE
MLDRILALLLFCLLGSSLWAHDPGLSTARVSIHEHEVAITMTFSVADLRTLHPPAAITPVWLAGLIEVRIATIVLNPASTGTRPAPSGEGEVQLELTFLRPEQGGPIEFKSLQFPALPPGHRQFVTVVGETGAILKERLLSASEPAVTFSLAAAAGANATAKEEATQAPSTFMAFLKLGVEHIWTGYDHLLFLFGLLVVCTRFRSIVAIISCFTLAHSLTLALATLDIVNLPSRYTEPLIAASIVYVGVENLVRRGAEPRGRWALTFLFGLIHGFGFASVLRELGVGQGGRGLAMPLFTFNLGVELGQVAIAALVLPIIWQLRKNEKFLRRGVPALSAVVALAGLYWLLERTIFA